MHFVAWLAGRSDAEAAALIEHARRARLGLYATTPLHLRPHDRVGLVMGYGGMSVAEIEQALVVFERCLDAVFPVQIGRAHVGTPVTNAHLVCRLLLENK